VIREERKRTVRVSVRFAQVMLMRLENRPPDPCSSPPRRVVRRRARQPHREAHQRRLRRSRTITRISFASVVFPVNPSPPEPAFPASTHRIVFRAAASQCCNLMFPSPPAPHRPQNNLLPELSRSSREMALTDPSCRCPDIRKCDARRRAANPSTRNARRMRSFLFCTMLVEPSGAHPLASSRVCGKLGCNATSASNSALREKTSRKVSAWRFRSCPSLRREFEGAGSQSPRADPQSAEPNAVAVPACSIRARHARESPADLNRFTPGPGYAEREFCRPPASQVPGLSLAESTVKPFPA